MTLCRFARCCKYYDDGAAACHDDGNAASSCAAAWQFDQHARGNRDIGTNVANIFIIRTYSGDGGGKERGQGESPGRG